MKREYKVLLSYFLACVCLVLVTNPAADAHPHVAMSDSLIVYLIVSPIYAPGVVAGSFMQIFFPSVPDGLGERLMTFLVALIAFAVPLIFFLAIAFRRIPSIVGFIAEARSTRSELIKRPEDKSGLEKQEPPSQNQQ